MSEPSREALEAAEILAAQLSLIEPVPLQPGQQWSTIIVTYVAFAKPKAMLARALDAFAAARVAEALVDAFDDESVTTADAGKSFMSRLAVKIVDLQAEARAQEREWAIRAVKNACWREEITAKAASIIISELAEPQEQT